MKSIKPSLLFALALIFLGVVMSVVAYQWLPDTMASHWDARGNVNGYMSKLWALFLMPILSFAILILMVFLPKIDPLKKNVDKFARQYYGFIVGIIAFLFYIHLISILWNLGFRFSMGQVLSPAFAVLFYMCGVLMSKARRNWFIGIRTPWTLSSDRVWDSTHNLGGKLFKASGVVCLLGIFLKDYAVIFVIIPVMVSVVVLMLYSYLEYKG